MPVRPGRRAPVRSVARARAAARRLALPARLAPPLPPGQSGSPPMHMRTAARRYDTGARRRAGGRDSPCRGVERLEQVFYSTRRRGMGEPTLLVALLSLAVNCVRLGLDLLDRRTRRPRRRPHARRHASRARRPRVGRGAPPPLGRSRDPHPPIHDAPNPRLRGRVGSGIVPSARAIALARVRLASVTCRRASDAASEAYGIVRRSCIAT